METLTHSLTGWTIARSLPQHRWGSWVAPAAIIGANLPDFEAIFVSSSDRPYYLLHHRAWSHSLIGIALEVFVATVLLWAAGRFIPRLRNSQGRPHFGPVLLVFGLSAISHLFLDWWNTYGVRPLFPWDPTWHYGDLVFIADPWIWLMLGGPLLLGTQFTRAENDLSPRRNVPMIGLWTLLGAAPLVFLFVMTPRIGSSWLVPLGWAALACWLLMVRTAGNLEIQPRKMASIGIILVGGYLVTLGFIGGRCQQMVLAKIEQSASHLSGEVRSSVSPVVTVPWQYDVLIETSSAVSRYRADLATGIVIRMYTIERNVDHPDLLQITDTIEYRAWKSFARYPVMRREGEDLLLGDARYQTNPNGPSWTTLRVHAPEK